MPVKVPVSRIVFWIATLEDARDGVARYPRKDMLPGFDDSESELRVRIRRDLKFALAQLQGVRENPNVGTVSLSNATLDALDEVMLRARNWFSRSSFMGFDEGSVLCWRSDLMVDLNKMIAQLRGKLPILYRRFEDLELHDLAGLAVAGELHVQRVYIPDDPAARSWSPREFYYLEWHDYDWPSDVGPDWIRKCSDVVAFVRERRVDEEEAKRYLRSLLEDYFDYAEDVFYENEDRVASEEGCVVHTPTLGFVAFAKELAEGRYSMELWRRLVRNEREEDDEFSRVVLMMGGSLKC